METMLFRDSLKFDVVKILDDNGLDSVVDGFNNEVTQLTNEQKEEIADKIIEHIFGRLAKDIFHYPDGKLLL